MSVTRKIMAVILAAVLVLLSQISLADFSGGPVMNEEYYIDKMQTPESRLKLRDEPSANGKILGQYYAGCRVCVINKKADWFQVEIGGKWGWMMAQFLRPAADYQYPPLPPAGIVLYPYATGDSPALQSLADNSIIMRIAPGNVVKVLGTLDDNWVHVAVTNEYGLETDGKMAATSVSHAESSGDGYVYCTNLNETVNLREKPSYDSNVVCQLYSGTPVMLLFDNYPTDNFARVRVGMMDGYMDSKYIRYPTEYSLARNPWAELQVKSCDVTNFFVDAVWKKPAAMTVTDQDMICILGKCTDKVTGENVYYCKGKVWVIGVENPIFEPDGEVPQMRTWYFTIPQNMVKINGKGSISATGKLKEDTIAYWNMVFDPQTGDYNPTADSEGNLMYKVLPGGAKVLIHSCEYGFPMNGYIADSSRWLCIDVLEGGDESWVYVPKDAVEFDSRLIAPEKYMNG